jgi:DNA-binding NtrC family response regulator
MAGSVLVVDDDPALVDALRRSLLGKEIVVDSALDVATACATLVQGRYCGLVLDLALPDGSGFDVLEHMERLGVEIPTIVVTQKLPSYVREMLIQDRVKLVFPKPIESRLLAALVLGLCGVES